MGVRPAQFETRNPRSVLWLRRYGLATVLLAYASSSPQAQELTPRAYWPAPKGTKVATIGYSHVSGDIVPDPSLPITGVDSNISTLNFAYLQTTSLWGRTTNVILELPYSSGDTAGDGNFGLELQRNYEGAGDAAATVSINLVGAPTMNPLEFTQLLQDPKPIVGGSLKLVAPTGNYDSDEFINVGANRWALKAELGLIIPINSRWLLEADLGSWFFGDNDDFFMGRKKEQKPIASVQAHLIRTFDSGLWISLNGNFYKGGRSTVDGRKLDDLQRDSKLGLTAHYPLNRRNILKAGYTVGSVTDSEEDFDILFFTYSHVF